MKILDKKNNNKKRWDIIDSKCVLVIVNLFVL